MAFTIVCSSSTIPTPTTWQRFQASSRKLSNISIRRLHLARAQLSTDYVAARESSKSNYWHHEVEMEVRDYELDQFGVVNNATYSEYCDHARMTMLQRSRGANSDAIAKSGCALAVAELSIKYVSHLKSRDKFVVRVRVSKWSASRLFIDHSIVKLPDQQPILEARATIVWLNNKYRPVRVPHDVIDDIITVSQ